ncbi:hypothetical protein WBK31_33220 [Nonomuraea sp. N2-4H]
MAGTAVIQAPTSAPLVSGRRWIVRPGSPIGSTARTGRVRAGGAMA